jgi:hypothetical protein
LLGFIVSLPIQKSAAKNFVATDSKIGSKTATLPMQRSTTKNYAATDPEIDSQNCAAANPESAVKYCAAADPEIGNNGGVVFCLTLSFFWVFTFLT